MPHLKVSTIADLVTAPLNRVQVFGILAGVLISLVGLWPLLLAGVRRELIRAFRPAVKRYRCALIPLIFWCLSVTLTTLGPSNTAFWILLVGFTAELIMTIQGRQQRQKKKLGRNLIKIDNSIRPGVTFAMHFAGIIEDRVEAAYCSPEAPGRGHGCQAVSEIPIDSFVGHRNRSRIVAGSGGRQPAPGRPLTSEPGSGTHACATRARAFGTEASRESQQPGGSSCTRTQPSAISRRAIPSAAASPSLLLDSSRRRPANP
jgi:hypothetical protein